MEKIRGTILLAERTYQTNSGLWIIAGTLNQIWADVHQPGQAFPVQLHVYIRVQFENPGPITLNIKLIDRDQPPHHPVLLEFQLNGNIDDPISPLEQAFPLPVFSVQCPNEVQIGAPQGRVLSVWLRVNDTEDIASANLAIIFRNPHDNDGPKRIGPRFSQPDGGSPGDER